MRLIKNFFVAMTTIFLVSCAWYRGPEIGAKDEIAEDQLNGFYSGPRVGATPSSYYEADTGGNYDMTSFDYE